MKRQLMISARQKAGLTRAQVAKKLFYSTETIKQLEFGNRYLAGWTNRKRKLWQDLASLYECSVDELGE